MRIHQELSSGSRPNASGLARKLEVSTKTIQRDLDFMRDRLGLPLAYEPARFGYHYTEEVDAFPTLQITEGELFALLVAEKALQQYRGTPFEKRLVGALKKLERTLPDEVSLNLAEWDQSISFRTTAEPVVDVPRLDILARAAQQRQQLRLSYRKPGGRDPEERVVDPYHLANVNGDWYLFAFDHLRGALRTFAPARILKAEPTGRTFQRPEKFAVDRLLRDSFGIHSHEGDFRVEIDFDPSVADYVREKRWHPSQKLVEQADGGVRVQLRLGSLVEVQRWVLGWGGAARAVAPAELVEALAHAAKRLADRHPAGKRTEEPSDSANPAKPDGGGRPKGAGAKAKRRASG